MKKVFAVGYTLALSMLSSALEAQTAALAQSIEPANELPAAVPLGPAFLGLALLAGGMLLLRRRSS
jgi:hypothetical protein